MPFRWVLFDVGDVLELCDDGGWPKAWGHRFAQYLDIEDGKFEPAVAAAELPDTLLRDDVEDEYWRLLGEAVGADDALLARMVHDFWDAYCGEPNTELVQFARTLTSDVRLAILSNSGDGARREEERRFGYSQLFDPICYSHEIGFAKPDPRAYSSALGAMNAPSSEVLFVDNAPANVEGARQSGITAILHRDNATTISALRAALHR